MRNFGDYFKVYRGKESARGLEISIDLTSWAIPLYIIVDYKVKIYEIQILCLNFTYWG